MAQLSTKVILYLESKSKTFESEKENFLIQDDGQGPYINEWNVTGVTRFFALPDPLRSDLSITNQTHNNAHQLVTRENSTPDSP